MHVTRVPSTRVASFASFAPCPAPWFARVCVRIVVVGFVVVSLSIARARARVRAHSRAHSSTHSVDIHRPRRRRRRDPPRPLPVPRARSNARSRARTRSNVSSHLDPRARRRRRRRRRLPSRTADSSRGIVAREGNAAGPRPVEVGVVWCGVVTRGMRGRYTWRWGGGTRGVGPRRWPGGGTWRSGTLYVSRDRAIGGFRGWGYVEVWDSIRES